MALMCVRMFPKESDKIEKYVDGLPDMIHESVMASKPKTMQDAIEFATELMDKKISTLAERQAENKRKLDNNNQAQQQPPQEARGCYSLCRWEGLCHTESSHHVTFVNESIFTYILKKQSSAQRHLIPNPKPRSRDTSLVSLRQFAIKLACQKSYADLKRKPMEFQIGDRVMLKGSPWKGVVHFSKRGKLNPIYVGPFKVLEKVRAVAYKLKLPQELSRVHNLKKCYADEPLDVPLDVLHIDDKLHFVEELVEIMDQEVRRLRQIRVPIVKV
ncbi:hypothetical protein Tco_1504123 [Tanacetum coccineum]